MDLINIPYNCEKERERFIMRTEDVLPLIAKSHCSLWCYSIGKYRLWKSILSRYLEEIRGDGSSVIYYVKDYLNFKGEYGLSQSLLNNDFDRYIALCMFYTYMPTYMHKRYSHGKIITVPAVHVTVTHSCTGKFYSEDRPNGMNIEYSCVNHNLTEVSTEDP